MDIPYLFLIDSSGVHITYEERIAPSFSPFMNNINCKECKRKRQRLFELRKARCMVSDLPRQ
jgi:hypothetical protein